LPAQLPKHLSAVTRISSNQITTNNINLFSTSKMIYFSLLFKFFSFLSILLHVFSIENAQFETSKNLFMNTNQSHSFLENHIEEKAQVRRHRRLVASGDSITYSYSGGYETVTVPTDVNSIVVSVSAASSGSGSDPAAGAPGYGANVQATISVTPGYTLYVFVGGQGGIPAGGWNGGGAGMNLGTGGGGASDIRSGGTSLNNRIIVAGGGGGYYYFGGCATPKGGDGGQVGSDGGSGTACGDGGGGGGGATQSTGGLAGVLGNGALPAASPGSLGLGGASAGNNAGGGGGGYYGGEFWFI
jgi:hypothetical protein